MSISHYIHKKYSNLIVNVELITLTPRMAHNLMKICRFMDFYFFMDEHYILFIYLYNKYFWKTKSPLWRYHMYLDLAFWHITNDSLPNNRRRALGRHFSFWCFSYVNFILIQKASQWLNPKRQNMVLRLLVYECIPCV